MHAATHGSDGDVINLSSIVVAQALISRVAWLLGSREHILSKLMMTVPSTSGSASGSARTSSSRGGSSRHLALSVRQIQSAFEIADTNGDGLVSLSEAKEVRCDDD